MKAAKDSQSWPQVELHCGTPGFVASARVNAFSVKKFNILYQTLYLGAQLVVG